MRSVQHIKIGTPTKPLKVVKDLPWPSGENDKMQLLRSIAVRDGKWIVEGDAVRIVDDEVEIARYDYFAYKQEVGARAAVELRVIREWEAAVDALIEALKHLKKQRGKPGEALAKKDYDKAIKALEEASENLG